MNLAFGYVNTAFGMVIGLVLIPFYIAKIGVTMYGYWLATGGVVYWLGMLDLGVGNIVGQRMAAAYGARDGDALGRYYAAGWTIQLVLVALLVLCALVLASFAPRIVGIHGAEARVITHCAFLAGLCLGVQFLSNAQSNTLNAFQRPVVKFIGQTVSVLVTIGGTYVLLDRGIGLYAIPGALLVGATLNLLIISAYVWILVRRSKASLRVDRSTVREMSSLASKAFTATSTNALVGRIEPTVITLLLGPAWAVGFSTTRRAAELLGTLMSMLVGSSSAGLTNLHASGDRSRTTKIVGDLFSLTFCISLALAVAYLTMNRSFVSLWIGEAYFAGTSTTAVLALATVTGVLSAFFVSVLGALGDFHYTYRLSAGEGLIRLLLMTGLLAVFGHVALVAGAAAGASLIIGLLAARRLSNHWRLPLGFDRSIQLTAASAALLLSGAILISSGEFRPGWPMFLLSGILVVACSTGILLVVNRRFRSVVSENLHLLRRFA